KPRHRAVELPPPMVRHDDAFHAAFARDPGVLLVHDAFHDELSLPLPADLLEVSPIEMVARREIAFDVPREDGRSALGERILEVRHPVPHERSQGIAEEPAWMREAVPCEAKRGPQRRGEARADV